MSADSKIRVMIVDDHLMLRRGLELVLKAADDLEMVGEAADGDQALDLCKDVRPHVVLMDMIIPGMDGATATRLIRERCPETQVIALTSFKDESLVHSALEAGAIGYLQKDVSAADLHEAIRSAAAGQATLSPTATQVVVRLATQPKSPGHNLTERELEVLALLVKGLHNDEIATRLVVSASTVKTHVSNIFGKLQVSSRAEAVAVAMRNGLV